MFGYLIQKYILLDSHCKASHWNLFFLVIDIYPALFQSILFYVQLDINNSSKVYHHSN